MPKRLSDPHAEAPSEEGLRPLPVLPGLEDALDAPSISRLAAGPGGRDTVPDPELGLELGPAPGRAQDPPAGRGSAPGPVAEPPLGAGPPRHPVGGGVAPGHPPRNNPLRDNPPTLGLGPARPSLLGSAHSLGLRAPPPPMDQGPALGPVPARLGEASLAPGALSDPPPGLLDTSPSPAPAPVTPAPPTPAAPTRAPGRAPVVSRRGAEEPEGTRSGPLGPGRLVGDYRLDKLLGQGASASVWKAQDLRLHMNIALKLFTPRGSGGKALLNGVMREARAASRVVSDHVIRVKDAGWFEDEGLGFIAMELCADYPDPAELAPGATPLLQVGRSLEQALPDSARACVRAVAQAARGVHDAHREGVFHRDIKPANILLRPGSRRAQITDFGLTVADLAPGRGSVRLKVGDGRKFILGTPEYMAPEAAQGLPLDLDAVRDRPLLIGLDVYGLGSTLYAILGGVPAFRPRKGAEDPVQDLLAQVRAGPPPALNTLPSLRFAVDLALVRVVERAMARQPDDRYASALELAEDLEAWLDNRPGSLDAPFAGWRLRLYLRRNRVQVSAAASLLVLAGALAGTALVGRNLSAQVHAAQDQIQQLEARQAEAQALAEQWEQKAGVFSTEAQVASDRARAALSEVRRTETSLDAAQKRLAALLVEKAALQDSLSATTQRAEQAELDRDGARAEGEGQRQRAEQAEGERDQAQAEGEVLLARAQRGEQDAQTQRGRADQAEQQLATTREDLDAARAQLTQLRQKLSEVQQAQQTAERRVAELQRESSRAQALADAARAENDALRRQLEVLQGTPQGP